MRAVVGVDLSFGLSSLWGSRGFGSRDVIEAIVGGTEHGAVYMQDSK